MVLTAVTGRQPKSITPCNIGAYTLLYFFTFQTMMQVGTVSLHAHVPEILTVECKTFPFLIGQLTVTFLIIEVIKELLATENITGYAFTVQINAVISGRVNDTFEKLVIRLIMRLLHPLEITSGQHHRAKRALNTVKTAQYRSKHQTPAAVD